MKKLKRLFADKNIIRSLHSQKMFGFAAVSAGFAALCQQASAQVIIDDNFTSGSQYGQSTIGLVPDTTNTPGGVWSLVGSGFGDSAEHKHTQNSVQFSIGGISTLDSQHNQGATAISLGAAPTSLFISNTVNPNGANGNIAANVIYLGFYSQVGDTSTTQSNYNGGQAAGDSAIAHLVGLSLDGIGDISYMVNGTSVASGITEAASPFDATTGFTTLSYDLTYNAGANTATFSDITLGGVSYSNTYTTGSLVAGASTIAFGGIGAGGGTRSGVTNFEVSGLAAAPEPSTYALLAGGALALGAYQYRRRQQYGI